jgi:hypothetical protein
MRAGVGLIFVEELQLQTGSRKTFKMKHNLTRSLMTSHQSAFRAIVTATLLTTIYISPPSAFADEASEIREHNNRGNLLLSRRLFQDAISEYETVLQINPAHAVAKYNLALAHNQWGLFLYSNRKYKEAKEQLDIALKINPNDNNIRKNVNLIEHALRNSAPPAASAATPKPTGPQDWNPFDESLDKPQVKKSFSNAATTSAPAVKATPAVGTNPTSDGTNSGASIIGGGGGSGKNAGEAGRTSFESNADSSRIGTSGASIVGGASSTENSSSISGGGKNNISGPSLLPLSNSNNVSSGFESGNASSPFLNKGGAGVATLDTTPPETVSGGVRIVGGSAGSASIIFGGAPAAANEGANSSVSSGNGTANVFPSPGSQTTNSVPTNNAPVRFTPRTPVGNVPMSWPGGESTAQSPSSRRTDGGAAKPTPSFLDKPEDNQPADQSEKTAEVDNSSSVEDLLAKMENKVYGKVSKNMPILKRIERLEVDTNGKKKNGSVAERLKDLKNTYGF